MKSKIIKVSIILIIMMFSVCLFNFCFALTASNFTIGKNFTKTSFLKVSSDTLWFCNANFEYVPITIDNIVTELSSSEIEDFINSYNNNGYVLGFRISSGTSYNLQCFVPTVSNAYLHYIPDGADYAKLMPVHYGDESYNYIRTTYILEYNVTENKWSLSYNNTGYSCVHLNDRFIIMDSQLPIYSKGGWNNGTLIYEPVKPPNDEELIANCDFKVNFKFSPDNDDYPTKVDKHWYVYETCLITHTMSNWSNYKIDMSISANKENSRDGANTYFELYNNDGDKLIDKYNLENNIAVNGNLAEGDFYLLLTDNISDVMTITYNIYNNNDELLLKKEYKLKFTQNGFGAVDFTGTIIADNTYDENGNIINETNTGFETNGNNAISGTGSSDYYDVTDLELITNNATNTINLAKQCFSILPGFIWVMVGIFLSVCLALRILGR